VPTKEDAYMAEAKTLNIIAEGFPEDETSSDVKIRLYYQSLEASRLSKAFENSQAKCSASVYLGEALALSLRSTLLPFSFSIETRPRLFVIKVRGHIIVEGSPRNLKPWTVSEADEPPKVWYRVYRDILKTASELARWLEVSLPEELAVET